MTDRRDLKRRIRARMARTGESYTTARKHVLEGGGAAPAPDPEPAEVEGAGEPAELEGAGEPPAAPAAPAARVPVIEMFEVTELAARAGLRCAVAFSSSVPAHLDRERVLARIRDALVGTDADPQTELLRAGVLRGELAGKLRAAGSHPILEMYRGTRQFLTRAAAGIGGVSASGTLLALVVDEQPIVCVLSQRGRFGEPSGEPWLLVTTPETFALGQGRLGIPGP